MKPTVTPLQGWLEERLAAPDQSRMTFREYMDACLYHPEYGYYTSDRQKLGKEGDFYTSGFIGGVFGPLIARELAGLHQECTAGCEAFRIMEWGGGDGRLAGQILDWLKAEKAQLYARLSYVMVESSPHHRALIHERLASHADKIVLLERPPWECGIDGADWMVFSNELLDAMPVHRLVYERKQWREIYVERRATGGLSLVRGGLSSPCLALYAAAYCPQAEEGQHIEVNLAAIDWISRIGSWLENGAVLTVDYGDFASELYAAHRMDGTLLCYFKHQAHDRVLDRPGEQDMTAHVNFSACIDAGLKAGLRHAGLRTQKQFMVDAGILELLQSDVSGDPFSPAAKRNRAIRQLLLSDGMSELFKVLKQVKTREA
ncbi:class I SAM-dependent methyltransferase [Paenibacillus sp. y28]|uniref:class I SAM-dependent methyltransferase n=1 Tax=Paenibacillus sp. y28 TaxID=3129110 RepID=UPI0030198D0A